MVKGTKQIWTENSGYYEENLKNDNTTFAVFNKKTGDWEFIPIEDYVNSFVDMPQQTKQDENKTFLQTFADKFLEEVTKMQNVNNVTDEETDKKQQIKKMYDYIKELETEQKAQEKGE